MLIQASLVAFMAGIAAAVKPMLIKDNYFVHPENGNRFQIVGVAYQPGGSAGYNPALGKDPLSKGDICLRDAALMQSLGVNAIRVYNLDPNLNHDACASIFNAAGIYMLLDVNSPLVGDSITSEEPWTSYYTSYLNRTFAVVEAFKSYPNTLAFFSGNEVISNVPTGATVPPYVRAVTRDLKNYIAKHSSRPIPVGYSAADVREVLFDTWQYMQCAIDGDAKDMSRGDLFALNSYSWCGASTFTTSGYDSLVAGFQGTSVPIFYSEYGCNVPSPRVFTEVSTLYGSQMMGVFSGGVVYEYAQEANNYGLVEIHDDGSATVLEDYYTLKAQFAKLDFKKVQGLSAVTARPVVPPRCEAKLISADGFSNNFTLPALPPGAQDIIDQGVKPAPSGKIIAISSWAVKQGVKAKNGTVITGLEVKPLANDAINEPGSNAGAGTGAGSPSGTPTPTPAANATETSGAPAVSSSAKKDDGPGGPHKPHTAVMIGLPVVVFAAAGTIF